MYIFVDKKKFDLLDKTEQKEILSGSGMTEGRLKDSVVTISHVDYIDLDSTFFEIKGKTYRCWGSGLVYMEQTGTNSNFTMPRIVAFLEEL